MAKLSNNDAFKMTLAICDNLDAVTGLNSSSVALSKLARNWLDTNPLDARFALINAKHADFMHKFCIELSST